MADEQTNPELADLLLKFVNGLATEEEREKIIRWSSEHPEYAELLQEVGEGQYLARQLRSNEGLKERIELQIKEKIAAPSPVKENDGSRRVVRMWRNVAAIAAVVALLAVGAWWFLVSRQSSNEAFRESQISRARDITAPESNRAVITLSDGQQVFLDSVSNGQLAMQGGVKLVKLADGQIVYQTANGELVQEVQYNTLNNPRGSKVIDLVLSDGTHVWLNAGSSIRYPVAFIKDERRVEITGEAYFEVTSSIANKLKQPFIVDANGISTKVLGTHFNVNAYRDEPSVKVTLLEGSVEVANADGAVMIKPGQQASGVANSRIQTSTSVDIDEVMSWKNNLFIFTGDRIETVMRQVERWYDLDVQYSGSITKEHFVGVVSRASNVSEVLKMMESTKKVKFEIRESEGGKGRKTIFVTAP